MAGYNISPELTALIIEVCHTAIHERRKQNPGQKEMIISKSSLLHTFHEHHPDTYNATPQPQLKRGITYCMTHTIHATKWTMDRRGNTGSFLVPPEVTA